MIQEKIRRLSEQAKYPLVCEAHERIPISGHEEMLPKDAPTDDVGRACYSLDDDFNPVMLWQCPGCSRWVCDGFGNGDMTPNICDDCWGVACLENPYVILLSDRLGLWAEEFSKNPAVLHLKKSRFNIWQLLVKEENSICSWLS